VRAWEKDTSEDLSGTMAAIDTALERADGIASLLGGSRAAPPPPPVNAGAGELDPSDPFIIEPELPIDPPPAEPPPASGPIIPDPSV
jgi:hypothetical protein